MTLVYQEYQHSVVVFQEYIIESSVGLLLQSLHFGYSFLILGLLYNNFLSQNLPVTYLQAIFYLNFLCVYLSLSIFSIPILIPHRITILSRWSYSTERENDVQRLFLKKYL